MMNTLNTRVSKMVYMKHFDAVLSFRKLKVGGYLIFDDYGWHDSSFGIDAFLSSYKKCYRMINPNHNTQVFIQKI